MISLFSRNKKIISGIKTLQRMATNVNNAADQENDDANRSKRLVWVDCEMTGLGAEQHRLVEIACIISEADLSVSLLKIEKKANK